MAIFFTADNHFGHANIIKYCNRPFADVDAMNAGMVEAWNAVVQPADTVYVIGDFAFHKRLHVQYLPMLNGRKILVRGNHDPDQVSLEDGWSEIHESLGGKLEGRYWHLYHYACRVWNHQHKGSFHLYGHSHNALEAQEWGRSMDVGIDAAIARGIGPRPFTLAECVEILSARTYEAL
jgi:calcineurin-like phosphoesterase family protein